MYLVAPGFSASHLLSLKASCYLIYYPPTGTTSERNLSSITRPLNSRVFRIIFSSICLSYPRATFSCISTTTDLIPEEPNRATRTTSNSSGDSAQQRVKVIQILEAAPTYRRRRRTCDGKHFASQECCTLKAATAAVSTVLLQVAPDWVVEALPSPLKTTTPSSEFSGYSVFCNNTLLLLLLLLLL